MATTAEALPDDPGMLKAMLLAERAESARLRQIIKELQRHRFGRRAESLPEEQLQLALEEIEQVEAAGVAEGEETTPTERKAHADKRRANRGALPAHLPRIEPVVDTASLACPCCSGTLHKIGEDVTERLDIMQAQFRVLVVRRPKYACRTCEDVLMQAPAPSRLIESGLPTEAGLKICGPSSALSPGADLRPPGRQPRSLDLGRLGRTHGVPAATGPREAARSVEGLTKLFADETTAPVLDPGRGQTKTGQLWAHARDDRPWGGTDPPGVAYVYAPDRKAERPIAHLAGFKGMLQVDGYGG